MDRSTRRVYLEALGLETWSPRAPAGAAPQAAPLAVAESAVAIPSPVARGTAATVRSTVPQDWEGLQAAVRACRACRLCETRTQTVFGIGPRAASLMVVGEGPGADEDAKGEPFVGRAGKLLDEMLRAIGRSRATDTYIANVVKCRPPGNREPAEDEAEACRGFLEQQLRLVKPKLIVALGRVAAQRLLATDTPIGKMRGQMYQWGPESTPLMVTYHPAYLLRNPVEKAKSWEDLKKVHRFLHA
jgi:uracil-DNA glycosylase